METGRRTPFYRKSATGALYEVMTRVSRGVPFIVKEYIRGLSQPLPTSVFPLYPYGTIYKDDTRVNTQG